MPVESIVLKSTPRFPKARTGLLVLLIAGAAEAANIGTVVPVLGTVADLVYDNQRQNVYLANITENRVEVYSVGAGRLLAPINVGSSPASLALSPDRQTLYIANNLTLGSISIVDLSTGALRDEISVGARPDAIAVGVDGLVLIAVAAAAGQANQSGLVRLDPNTRTITPVAISPPPNPILNVPPGGMIATFRAKLQATPDGLLIFGLSNNRLFVYEVASGLVLRSRNVTGLNAALSVAPDGNRFMVGPLLFDTNDLTILGRAGYPSPNIAGGSTFSLDGNTIYSSFSNQTVLYPENRNQPIPGGPATIPGVFPRPGTAATIGVMQLLKTSNTRPTMALRLPDSITNKMVLSADGQNLFAISNSGMLVVPVGRLNTFPIVTVDREAAMIAADICNRNPRSLAVRISNAGAGRLTYAALANVPGSLPTVAPTTSVFVIVNQASGVAPGNMTLTFDPRARAGAMAIAQGTTQAVIQIVAPEAVNIEPTIMLNLNYRDVDQVGEIYPVAGNITDLVYDTRRQRIYLVNQPYGQVEIFNTVTRTFLPPIEVGAEPRAAALAGNNLLLVTNQAGEGISVVDVDTLQMIDRIPLGPIALNAGPFVSSTIAVSNNAILFNTVQIPTIGAPAPGAVPQFLPGQLWQLSLTTRSAFPRPNLGALNGALQPNAVNALDPRTVVRASGDGSAIIVVSAANNGTVRLYDATTDNIPVVRTGQVAGYRGAVTAAADGSYFVIDSVVFTRSLALQGTINTAAGTFTQAVVSGGAQQILRVRTAAPAAGGQAADVRMRLERLPLTNLAANLSLPMVEAVVQSPTAPRGQVQLLPTAMAIDSPTGSAFLLTTSGLAAVPLSVTQGIGPTFTAAQVVNGASFRGPVAAGAIVTIFGSNLGSESSAQELPLPTTLGGTCLLVNDTPVPLFYSSPTQINAQIPPAQPTGNVTFGIRNLNTGRASTGVAVPVVATSPGIFTVADSQNRRMAALYRIDAAGDLSLVTPDNRAFRDERALLFATGLGATSPTVAAGVAAPSSPPARVANVQVCVGGVPYQVEFAGLAPGFVGLYQINLYVPGERAQGVNLPVVITTGGADCRNASTTGAPTTSIR